jgi:hypothetical protein
VVRTAKKKYVYFELSDILDVFGDIYVREPLNYGIKEENLSFFRNSDLNVEKRQYNG